MPSELVALMSAIKSCEEDLHDDIRKCRFSQKVYISLSSNFDSSFLVYYLFGTYSINSAEAVKVMIIIFF